MLANLSDVIQVYPKLSRIIQLYPVEAIQLLFLNKRMRWRNVTILQFSANLLQGLQRILTAQLVLFLYFSQTGEFHLV
jgi:hypothetical protein